MVSAVEFVMLTDTKVYAAEAAGKPLHLNHIQRRSPGDKDVVIDILYCGVCHSDIHTVRNEWGGTHYPCVPGHEIVGKVTHTGRKTSRQRGFAGRRKGNS
jgi:uncharacterized zinc-type alcohol dehydrogenase-like protein